MQRHGQGTSRSYVVPHKEPDPDAVVHPIPYPPVAQAAMSQPTSIHAQRDRRRLAAAVRQAAMHATPAEMVTLRRVIDAANTGHITTTAARLAVASLRATQAQRNGWPPKRAHDPSTCTLMVCPEPECIEANGRRTPQGAHAASPFRRAA